MNEDSDGIPFEESELTPGERARLRKMLTESERASWAWRRARVVVPAFVAVIAAGWASIDWVLKHLRFAP